MNIPWPALLLICGILIAVVLVLFLPVPSSRRKARIPTNRPHVIFRDDDRYRYAGLFYNNPDDPAVFVPRRIGFGWSVNFGHPLGRLFMIGILLIVLLFGVIVPLLFSGMTPLGCHPSGCHMLP
jgi:uncharacterized membrane protein